MRINEETQEKESQQLIEINKFIFDDEELYGFTALDQLYLIDPILPKIGVGVLAAKPDVGKSMMTRQIAFTIAGKIPTFAGFKINATHHSALLVLTEDFAEHLSHVVKKQLDGLGLKPSKRVRFLFAEQFFQTGLIQQIDQELTEHPADFVVIDAFGDVFMGSDSNKNIEMRNTVSHYSRLARKHSCFILFVHHINKNSYNENPEQQHIQGGSGLVQKARVAMTISEGEAGIRLLTIVKGNYVPKDLKNNAIILEFSEDTFLFTDTGQKIKRDSIAALKEDEREKESIRKLEALAGTILENRALTYLDFINRFIRLTDRSRSSAKRDLKKMLDYGIVTKNKRLYSATPKYNLFNTDEKSS